MNSPELSNQKMALQTSAFEEPKAVRQRLGGLMRLRESRRAVNAKKPAGGGGRLTELDGLRSIMIIVILFHCYQASQAETSRFWAGPDSVFGVVIGNIDLLLPIFFMLSGFALYFQLVGTILRGKALPRSRDFLLQRAFRLLPLYFLAFLVVWVARFGGGRSQWNDLFWGLTLTQTWKSEQIFRVLDPAWYLSVEWTFAVLTAVAILPWLRRVQRWTGKSRLLGILAPPVVLIMITIWWKSNLIEHEVDFLHRGAWFAPPSWALLYGVGMLFALILIFYPPNKWRWPKQVPFLLVVISLSWGLVMELSRGDNRLLTYWYFEFSIPVTLLWFFAILAAPEDGVMRRFWRNPLIQILAASSFATYLTHAPILRSLDARGILPMNVPEFWLLNTAALIVLCLLVGYLAHRFIELPTAKLDKLFSPKSKHDSELKRTKGPSIQAGDVIKSAGVLDLAGMPFDLANLADRDPVLLLIHPIEPTPRAIKEVSGLRSAIRALDSHQAAAKSMDIRLATLSPDLLFVSDIEGSTLPNQTIAENDEVMHLIDRTGKACESLGVRVFHTMSGRAMPEMVAVAIDEGGTVLTVSRELDRDRMVDTVFYELVRTIEERAEELHTTVSAHGMPQHA